MDPNAMPIIGQSLSNFPLARKISLSKIFAQFLLNCERSSRTDSFGWPQFKRNQAKYFDEISFTAMASPVNKILKFLNGFRLSILALTSENNLTIKNTNDTI
jgi:hypothetical protein